MHGAFLGVGSVVASRLAQKGKQAQTISTMFTGLKIANLLTPMCLTSMMLFGLGMFVGNVVVGKLADRFSPMTAALTLLLAMAGTLLTIFFASGNQVLSLGLTFTAGSCALAVAAPIQILMIQSSKDAEMLGASITQAAFNIGNALGAFMGVLPLVLGYGYTSPALVGVGLALAGAGFAYALAPLSRKQPVEPAVNMVAH